MITYQNTSRRITHFITLYENRDPESCLIPTNVENQPNLVEKHPDQEMLRETTSSRLRYDAITWKARDTED